MNFEFFLANKLKTGGADGESKSATPSLNIAVIGMTLAIVIMILSINIISGFKNEISNKIYGLDSHLRVPSNNILSENSLSESLIDSLQLFEGNNIYSIYKIAEKPAILKTNVDFKGVLYRGVDNDYDWKYIQQSIIEGVIPNDSLNISDVVISKKIANSLNLKVGQKLPTYFIDNKVKVRNCSIVGIYNTNFEEFDNNYIIGNIKQIQSINNWNEDRADYIGIKCINVSKIDEVGYSIYSQLNNDFPKYTVQNTYTQNGQFFTWLQLLDMNVIIIIVIMLLVTSFTLISSMLMIVLERINMIGILKAMGAENKSIRKIFIYITNKLIIKSLLIGNIIAIGLSYLQYKLHFISLDPEAYYIDFVPVSIDWIMIILLNFGVILVSYITLLAPSHIITKIEPSKSIRFE